MADDGKNPFDRFLASLSDQARRALTARRCRRPADDGHADYERWRSDLSDAARAWVDGQRRAEGPAEAGKEEVDEDGLGFGCVEVESGEFPVVRIFRTAEALARHVGRLEGRDVCVVPFWGAFLKLSKGPLRLVQMPDRATLLSVPRDGDGRIERIDADDVTFDWQEDGFVGPYELANSAAFEARLDAMAAQGAGAGGDAGDDKDEDEGEDGEDDGLEGAMEPK
jgi:hypothetical protein